MAFRSAGEAGGRAFLKKLESKKIKSLPYIASTDKVFLRGGYIGYRALRLK